MYSHTRVCVFFDSKRFKNLVSVRCFRTPIVAGWAEFEVVQRPTREFVISTYLFEILILRRSVALSVLHYAGRVMWDDSAQRTSSTHKDTCPYPNVLENASNPARVLFVPVARSDSSYFTSYSFCITAEPGYASFVSPVNVTLVTPTKTASIVMPGLF